MSLSFPVMFLVARTHVYSLAGRRLADQDEVRMCRRWPKYVVWEAVAQAREAEHISRCTESSGGWA